MKSILSCLFVFTLLYSCNSKNEKKDHQIIEVKKTATPPTIDGRAIENNWNMAKWHTLDQNWIGSPYTHEDFNGRYKLSWGKDALYLLVEITDDVLDDQNKDPLKLWWNDDCVEVFVDEDNSGGEHQFSHNAFAYHIGLNGDVVDLAPTKEPTLYNDHITSAKVTQDHITTWEMAIKLYDDQYLESKENTPTSLSKNKKVGFALAYCDNDGSTERENFIGSVFVPGEDKNQGWINADIFGTLVLKE